MKRLASVLLFLGIAVLVFGSVILYMEKAARQRANDVASTRFIRVYTDMPADFIQTVGQAFARKEKINIVVVPLTTSQILDSTLRSDNTGDVVITSQEVLQQLSEKKELAPYSSPASDTVMHQYRAENDTWTGIWIDPVVFAVNRDFYAENPDYIYTWDNVVTSPMTRLSVTDFVSSSEAEDLLYSMSERFGEDGAIGRLAYAGTHIEQYGKFLSTPARMAAMDKVDIGISSFNEVMRVKNEHLPIAVVYPDDGQPWYLYGIGIFSDAAHKPDARRFVDWLLTGKTLDKAMNASDTYYLSTNELRRDKDERGHLLSLWNLKKVFVKTGRDSLKKRWVTQVRFARDTE